MSVIDWREHAPLLIAVYRCSFDLLRSDVFTGRAMHRAIPFSGYRQDEVDAALAELCEHGDLLRLNRKDDLIEGWDFYVAGPRHPLATGGVS